MRYFAKLLMSEHTHTHKHLHSKNVISCLLLLGGSTDSFLHVEVKKNVSPNHNVSDYLLPSVYFLQSPFRFRAFRQNNLVKHQQGVMQAVEFGVPPVNDSFIIKLAGNTAAPPRLEFQLNM